MGNELEEIVINGKNKIELKLLKRFNSIEKLSIINGNLDQDYIEVIEQLNIKKIQLSKVKVLSFFKNNTSVEKLYISNITFNSDVDIKTLRNLSLLRIFQCKDIKHLKLTNSNLEEIYINNSNVECLEGVETLKKIKTINLDGSNIKESFKLPATENVIFSNKKEYKQTTFSKLL